MNYEKPVILFDGVCNLCNKSVQQIIKRDVDGKLLYSSLQSEFGQEFLADKQLPKEEFNSFILKMPNGDYFTKSDAALEVLNQLRGKYKTIGSLLKIFPKAFRDLIYDWVSQNRYKIFGKKESCMLPKPEWKERFID